METFYSDLSDASNKWFPIGRQLGVDDSKLKSLESKYGDENSLLKETLGIWLDTTSDCSWESLVSALEDPSVDKHELAEKLRGKHCPHLTQKSKSLVCFILKD